MYNIELVCYALLNQIDDSTIYKIQKIKEYYLDIVQDNVFLYNFKNKEEACQYLIDHIVLKSLDDVQRLYNSDKELIKLVLENKALFDDIINVFSDIKEKAKSFKHTVFEFETIEDYKAALEDFIMNDETVIVDNDLTDNGAAAAMSDNETPDLDKISEMLDDEFDALCDMEQRGEMLNGKELPTKPKYAIAERALGLDATE